MFNGISRFFCRFGPDPTEDWPPVRIGHIVIDTVARTVSDVEIPCDPQRLRTLGRPSNRHSMIEKIVRYDGLGAMLWLNRAGRVCDVGVCLIPMNRDGPPARRCEIVGKNGRCELTPGAQIGSITAILGDVEIDEDDNDREIVRTFHLGGFELVVECAPDGIVRYVNYFAV